ncbi:methyltransferase [Streptomyces indonesiensis]
MPRRFSTHCSARDWWSGARTRTISCPAPTWPTAGTRLGYLSWALNANRPYIDNATSFLREPRRQARSTSGTGAGWRSRPAGSGRTASTPASSRRSPAANRGGSWISAREPHGLLIHLLTALPDSTGLALDLSAAACEEAERAARRAEVGDRLEVVNRSIESLVEDHSPVRDADVVHAGFVMHDVVSRPDVLDGVLRACRASIADGGASW